MVQKQGTPLVHTEVKHIVLVEDEADIAAFLVHVIEQETLFEVTAVSDGLTGMHVIQEVKPQLIIVDYLLPGMNGIDLYDHLQSNEETTGIPTIMLSANLPIRDLARRQIIGLQKPFDLVALLDTMETLLA